MKRKVVFIEIIYPKPLQVGMGCTLIPLNHYATDRVTNGHACDTTPVVTINNDGSFETLNTLYVPIAKDVDVVEAIIADMKPAF